jgi:hypothetical protein
MLKMIEMGLDYLFMVICKRIALLIATYFMLAESENFIYWSNNLTRGAKS